MLKSTEGIVLYSIKYGDSGIITQIYTHSEGLKSFIAQGLGRKGNLRKSHFQHLNLLEINYYSKEKAHLSRIKESKIIKEHSNLEVQKIYIFIFTAEFLKNVIKEEEPNTQLYTYLKNWIMKQENSLDPIKDLLEFMLSLSKFLGFFPMNNQGKYFNLLEGSFQNRFDDPGITLTEENSTLLKNLLTGNTIFSSAQTKEIFNMIMRFYTCHLHGFREPKSSQMLEIVWW